MTKNAPRWAFSSIVLWAMMLVFMLNMCRSRVESAAVETVDYSDFYEWVDKGYVAEVKLDANVYTFTLKEDAPPLKELVDKMSEATAPGRWATCSIRWTARIWRAPPAAPSASRWAR